MKSTRLRPLLLGSLIVCAAVYLLPVLADTGKSTSPRIAPPPVSAPAQVAAAPAEPEAPILYGIRLEGLSPVHGEVQRGETLAGILGRYGVPYDQVHQAAKACDGIFDLRQMRAGHPYCAIQDEAGGLRYWVYEASLRDYVVFDLTEAPAVSAGQKPVRTDLRQVSATVASSLWDALQGQGVGPETIVQLDEVFGQVVDLFYLQPGDEIRIVYEEHLVDGQRAPAGRIQAARLVHQGRPYNAFYHETAARRGYFDETGRSLQRAFLKAPLKYARISSGFTDRRLHPILNIYRKHHAIDYAAPLGTPVLAVGDGKVMRAGHDKNAGRFIRLRHGSRYESRYIHLSRFADGMRPGRSVKRGEVIGYVGQTGLATGPHLDFAFYRDGAAVNFRRIESPPADPVAADQMARFQARVAQYSDLLESPMMAESESPDSGGA